MPTLAKGEGREIDLALKETSSSRFSLTVPLKDYIEIFRP